MLAGRIDTWLTEAEQKGVAKGLEQGYDKAAKELLLKQLKLKFGSLTLELQQRIQAMQYAEIALCMERVLTAHCIDDVLPPTTH